MCSLVELDTRRLYLARGYSSLFTYCTQALGLSEDAAYFRIEAVRAAQRFPSVLDRLAEGGMTLTAVKLLRPHLTSENHRDLLDAARGKTKRAIEEMVARIRPQPDVPSSVRRLPASRSAASGAGVEPPGNAGRVPMADEGPVREGRANTAAAEVSDSSLLSLSTAPIAALPGSSRVAAVGAPRLPGRPPVVAPLAPDRYKIQITVSAETHARLRRAQELLRHAVPDGDPAVIFDRALVVLLERLERTKWAAKKETQHDCRKKARPSRASSRSSSAAASRPRQAAVSGYTDPTERVPKEQVRCLGEGPDRSEAGAELRRRPEHCEHHETQPLSSVRCSPPWWRSLVGCSSASEFASRCDG